MQNENAGPLVNENFKVLAAKPYTNCGALREGGLRGAHRNCTREAGSDSVPLIVTQ